MARSSTMSNFAFLLFFALVWNSNGDTGTEGSINDQEISVKLLKHLNEEQGTKYQFNAAKTIETQFKVSGCQSPTHCCKSRVCLQ
jgi:hypothetical protein